MNFKGEIVNLLAKEIKRPEEEIVNFISIPPDSKLGDYAFPCFKLGKNAKEEAEKLKAKIKLPDFIAKVEVAGPYLNFFIKNKVLIEETLSHIYQEQKQFGSQNLGKGKKNVIDFSSPNIAKPFGIGHLRSTVIGNALSKVYRALGYEVIGVNHLGDWGTQFGKLIVAYNKWGSEEELKKDPIKYLLELYVKFHQEAEKDKTLEDEARAEFKKLEDGNKEALVLWKTFKDLSLVEFKKIYKLLGVEFEAYSGEAFYNDQLDSTINLIKKKGITEMSEGALIVNLEKYNMPPAILRKSDGATLYLTRDIAAALYRKKVYKFSSMLYEVGAEQKLHFQQLFKVLELLDYSWAKDCAHIEHGLYLGSDGKKLSTRKGKTVFITDILDEAIASVKKIIQEKNPTLKNKEIVAQHVGVGAIIFGDLYNDRTRDIIFDIDKFTSFDGETAPYLQYTHARACSILRKAVKEHQLGVSPHVNFGLFQQAEEIAVVKKLNQFPEVLEKVAQDNKPHHLAHYLIALAQAFNEFYHQCPVLSEDKNQTKARLLLVDSVRQVLENGLNLLGIKAPQEM